MSSNKKDMSKLTHVQVPEHGHRADTVSPSATLY